ncbi:MULTISPECIES: hypothetical protein [unclassified Paenibacillus]|uniref:Uncharacterized protein n=1 Tax=Paenibacillus provencensis TaxID=441151 RepID=A0ABW3Q0J8_9BACL|nr:MULTISPECIES: hypothetical protein [unclassified Paenibacillus]MCM3129296.1 hypothetical protein [Paenibacillus sp. MER 78]
MIYYEPTVGQRMSSGSIEQQTRTITGLTLLSLTCLLRFYYLRDGQLL